MNLLLPIFLGAATLIGLPILLHLLRRKPTVQVIFPTLQFLGPAAVRETRRHRLRRWLTLLLRCLIVLLICLAFSRPYWTTDDSGSGRAVVVAVDNSYSMQTKGRWEKLRGWASAQLASLGSGDRAGLLLMNPTPRWLVPMTDKLDAVRSTLASLPPGYETTRYEPVLRLVGDTLAQTSASKRSLVWMADEQQLGWQSVNFGTPLPANVDLVMPPVVDPPARQASIAKVSWTTADQNPALHVEVRQYTPAQDTRQLTVSAGGNVLARQTISLSVEQSTGVDVPLSGLDPAKAQGITVALDPDDLPTDDTFYTVHDPGDATKVYLTALPGDEDFDFLRHAIDATKQITAAPLQASDLPDADWPLNGVVLVRGDAPFQAPLVARLNAFLQAGGTAWFFLDGSSAQIDWMKTHHVDLRQIEPSSDNPLHLSNWDTTHPSLAPLAQGSLIGLLDVEFYHGVALDGLSATPLATWDDGSPALAEVNADGMRFLACGFGLGRNFTDWSAQGSFVPFVHASLVWLMRQQHNADDRRVGDAVLLPGDGTWQCVEGPGATDMSTVSGSVRPQTPGLYQFTSNGQSHLYAVNVKSDESDPAPWPTPADFAQLTHPGDHPIAVASVAAPLLTGEDAENHQRVWWWLLVLAVILILAELRLSNRTSL